MTGYTYTLRGSCGFVTVRRSIRRESCFSRKYNKDVFVANTIKMFRRKYNKDVFGAELTCFELLLLNFFDKEQRNYLMLLLSSRGGLEVECLLHKLHHSTSVDSNPAQRQKDFRWNSYFKYLISQQYKLKLCFTQEL